MMDPRDSAAKLNEYAQGKQWELSYEISSVGPDHDKTFTISAVLNGKAYVGGVGKTKKEAKQNAAENTLRLLEMEQQNPIDSTENASANPTASVYQTSVSDDYISLLHKYCGKKKIPLKAVESISMEPKTAALKCCSFVVDNKEYPPAFGKTKKEAKEEAAKIAYQSLDVKSEDQKARGPNFIGIVDHYCQKTCRILNFIEVERCGPPHNSQFFYKAVINGKDYPIAEGKSAKNAKQKAAELAWSGLQEQSDWDSKVSFRSSISQDSTSSLLTSPTMLQSQKTSQQSITRNTSQSVILTIASDPVQVPMRSAVSVDSAPSMLSTPSSLESLEASSQSMATGTSDSVVFTDSSNPSNDKDAAKNKNRENRPTDTSTQSRFTSEFDSIKSLAKGGFGRVYKAREKLVDNYYAVKIVPSKEKTLREVVALSELLHFNIVRYYNCWMEDSEYEYRDSAADSSSTTQSTSNSSSQYLYIKMELCDNKTLKDWINEKNKETLQDSRRREKSLPIAQQIVSGVELIHSKNFIHRDLKPANILFGQGGEVKIGDFGLVAAENDDDDDDDKNQTERTGKTGTKSYMAPEQRNKKMYDRKVDIFALGLIYFELLWNLSTGHERGVLLTNARSQKLPEEFSQNFPKENELIMSMLCEKPEDRPEARTLKTELEEWAQIFNAQNNMHQQNKTV
ncbi:interferon-induced%2C double-stranded RNA-activated protein kinase-like [Scomber scombrus]|uniref:non-specific serine/threonine protein kinase n=1 Tax=Scomber scombrus TaxID=13677 RepID=A0AAV1MYE8_SCOSC